MRAALVSSCVILLGCFNVTVGAGDLNPITYDETFVGIPDLSMVPDGEATIMTQGGTPVTVSISTDDDGNRMVVLELTLVVEVECNDFGSAFGSTCRMSA